MLRGSGLLAVMGVAGALVEGVVKGGVTLVTELSLFRGVD